MRGCSCPPNENRTTRRRDTRPFAIHGAQFCDAVDRALPRADGYLLKERISEGSVLVDALRRISEGETVIDPTIVSLLFGRRRRHNALAALSGREREVLSLVAEGRSNKAIATQLFITERAVEAHTQQVF
jgi:DNA-binding NarL/FixJ family response regulator